MKIETDFGKYVTLFFTQYLVGERGVSPHTLRSYSDTFNLFYDFMSLVRSVPAHKVRLKDVTHQTIKDFLFGWKKKRITLCQHGTYDWPPLSRSPALCSTMIRCTWASGRQYLRLNKRKSTAMHSRT